MDRISPDRRSANMSRIRHKDTTPELVVRRIVHRLGYRYRLHRNDLPGKPDIAFGPRKKLIFVHGCFWHQHSDCRAGRIPSANAGYWRAKLERNVQRDADNLRVLQAAGWEILILWECQVAELAAVEERLVAFLSMDLL
ncbi:very short patch repair endonuclease [Mesorhizobium sp. M0179]|uniref:very short patch repair endonuclease n=1 Tax=Mesorhizobium sp. M0179 TaxID=2956905 RepID=UPI00333BC09B